MLTAADIDWGCYGRVKEWIPDPDAIDAVVVRSEPVAPPVRPRLALGPWHPPGTER